MEDEEFNYFAFCIPFLYFFWDPELHLKIKFHILDFFAYLFSWSKQII